MAPSRDRRAGRAGFTLIELLVVISIIVLLVGLLVPALREARRLGRLAVCQSNMTQHGKGGSSYATDFEDRQFAFSWRPGNTESSFADLRAQAAGTGPLAAASAQAVDILRRRAGRTDMPVFNGWIPHVLYTHLVLQDYWASRLPERLVVCPEDTNRLGWQERNGELFDRGHFGALQATGKQWPYSSSYQVVPASYDAGQSRQIGSAPGGIWADARVWQDGPHWAYAICPPSTGVCSPLMSLSGTRIADVAFPANKVMLSDEIARHFGRDLYYGYPEARAPLLFYDGSVRVLRTSDTNEGWLPVKPDLVGAGVATITYEPRSWEPASPNPGRVVRLPGHYRWTRGGLHGVDVQGDAVRAGLR